MKFARTRYPASARPPGRSAARTGWRHLAAAVLGTTVVLGSTVVPLVETASPAAATAPAHPSKTAVTTAATSIAAYWLVARDGGVFAFGGAPFYGSMGGTPLNKPVVGMANVGSSGSGYWLDASDGGVFSFGPGAQFYGSTGSMALNLPVVGMASTPDGRGYWLVASDGGIFAFGDAQFYGSMGSQHLNQPVVGMASTTDGGGYWLVAADGGIFSFGDAQFCGSTGSIALNKPIVGMTANPAGGGYWFTASDGGVFAFGSAGFLGSLGSVPQSRPIVAITSTPDGRGYWFSNNNGAVTSYGDATYWGSAPQILSQPVVGMAEGPGSGSFSGSAYPSGSYGYDISNYQIGNYPPLPHTIGIVQVAGASFGLNQDLANEAAWAAGGLNLYIFLTYGTTGQSGDQACATSASPGACNFGFNAALDAFSKAQAARIDTSVAWWLDVESNPSWSGNQAANAALVQGAIDGLHYEGLNGVGIYASPGNWSGIVGNYTPAVPYWAADWGLSPAATCQNIHAKYSILPSGPVQLIQYSSPSFPFPQGGMSTAYDNDYAC
jgi:hypothetical protein